MRIRKVSIIFGIGALLLSACTAMQNPYNTAIRAANDVPDRFIPSPGVLLDPLSCKSPMIDPRDGSELIMVGSQNGVGLYSVSGPKYGLQKGEVLKINCSNGEALGIVKASK